MGNKSDKRGSATMLYITLWSFAASLNLVCSPKRGTVRNLTRLHGTMQE
jgi:hypothetical protein